LPTLRQLIFQTGTKIDSNLSGRWLWTGGIIIPMRLPVAGGKRPVGGLNAGQVASRFLKWLSKKDLTKNRPWCIIWVQA